MSKRCVFNFPPVTCRVVITVNKEKEKGKSGEGRELVCNYLCLLIMIDWEVVGSDSAGARRDSGNSQGCEEECSVGEDDCKGFFFGTSC